MRRQSKSSSNSSSAAVGSTSSSSSKTENRSKVADNHVDVVDDDDDVPPVTTTPTTVVTDNASIGGSSRGRLVTAISPSGTMIASIHPTTTRRTNNTNNENEDEKEEEEEEEEDTMVMITIQPIPPSVIGTTTTTTTATSFRSQLPSQTIRIPAISSYLLSSPSVSVQVVRRRRLIWLGETTVGGDGTMQNETPFLGLITTLGVVASTPNVTTPSTTTTLITVIDRTRGIPIYTVQCNDPNYNNNNSNSNSNNSSSSSKNIPTIIHDSAKPTTTSTITTNSGRRSTAASDGSFPTTTNSSSSSSSCCCCIGIFNGRQQQQKSPFYYIAIARWETSPTSSGTSRRTSTSTEATEQEDHHSNSNNNNNNNNNNNKVQVVLYECQVTNGKVVRKIKLGHYYYDSTSRNHLEQESSVAAMNQMKKKKMLMMMMSVDYTNQPWMAMIDTTTATATATATTNDDKTKNDIANPIISYVFGSSGQQSEDINDNDGDDDNVVVVRGMNLMDGSKLYKWKLQQSPNGISSGGDGVAIQSSLIPFVSTKSTNLSLSSSGMAVSCLLLNRNGIIRLFDTVTGTTIASKQQQKSNNDAEDDDDDDDAEANIGPINVETNKLQLQMIVVSSEMIVDEKKRQHGSTSKKKEKGTSESLFIAYAWILVGERTLLQVKLSVNTEDNRINDYTIEQRFTITTATTKERATMRCFLVNTNTNHNAKSINTNNVRQSAQLVVVLQSHDLMTNAIQAQTIPLLPNMTAVGKENVINVVFDSIETASKHVQNDDTYRMSIDGDIDYMEVETDPIGPNTTDDATTATTTGKKRKQLTTVLGPGQSGGEARNVTEANSDYKRLKQNDDENITNDDANDPDNEPTIAERLRLLQQALDAEDEEGDDDDDDDDDDEGESNNADGIDGKNSKFVAKHATTESLTQLLIQALQSSDGTMLEQAFQVRDKNILRMTCQSLSSDQVLVLLDALIQRLSSKPSRAEQLVAWVSAILQSNQITNIQHLQPLQNLLSERLEVFPLLLQLEGRLENMIGM